MDLKVIAKCRPFRNLPQIVLTMKITAVLLLVACLQVNAKSYSQQITLSETNAPLQEVFEKIEQQTSYTFAYTATTLSKAKRVSIRVSGASLDETLRLCFLGQPFSYTIIEKTVVVKEKTVMAMKSEIPMARVEG